MRLGKTRTSQNKEGHLSINIYIEDKCFHSTSDVVSPQQREEVRSESHAVVKSVAGSDYQR